MEFFKKVAAPASGKSYGSIRYMVKEVLSGSKFVVAAISSDLCQQLKSDIEDYAPHIRVKLLLHTLVSGRERVQDVYKSVVEEQREFYDVVIITHQTLINSYGKVEGFGWNIMVDELPNLLSMRTVTVPTLEDDSLSRWLTYVSPDKGIQGYQEMTLKVGWERKLEVYLAGIEDDKQEESYISPTATVGLKGLLSDNTIILRKQATLGEEEKIRYAFGQVFDPHTLFLGFGECTFLCADFDNQLTGLIFKHKYGIPVTDRKEITLRRDSYKSPERIKIYPLLKAPKTFTKTLSDQWYCSVTNRNFNYNREDTCIGFFEHLVNVASDIVGEDGYIYTINKIRKDEVLRGTYPFLQESDRVKCLKYNPHGLNNYMDYNTALGLFHCNPRPIDRVILQYLDKTCNTEEGTFEKGYITTSYLDPIFQLVSRSKIRDFTELEDIVCIVPDYRVADYLLKGWFKGATVDYRYAVETTDTRGRPEKFQQKLNMSSTEKKAYSRMLKREGLQAKNMNTNNTKHLETVVQWLSERRGEDLQ
jgi:hypothetical protein